MPHPACRRFSSLALVLRSSSSVAPLFRSYPLMGCYFLGSANSERFGPHRLLWLPRLDGLYREPPQAQLSAHLQVFRRFDRKVALGDRGSAQETPAQVIFTDVKRVFPTASPLGDLKGLERSGEAKLDSRRRKMLLKAFGRNQSPLGIRSRAFSRSPAAASRAIRIETRLHSTYCAKHIKDRGVRRDL